MPINYVKIEGTDVANLVADIEDVVEGKHSIAVSCACIVVAVLAQNPVVEPEKLQAIVRGVSEYMAASLFDESSSGAIN